jgi:hypothetical protein
MRKSVVLRTLLPLTGREEVFGIWMEKRKQDARAVLVSQASY